MHKIDPYWEDLPGAAGIRLRPHRGSQPGPCSLPAGSRAVTQVIEKRDAAAALQAFMDLHGAVGELPLCRLYRKDLRFFGKMQVSMCGEEGGHRSKTERTAQPRLNRNKGPEMCSESLLCRTDRPWFTFGICDEHPQRVPLFCPGYSANCFSDRNICQRKGQKDYPGKDFHREKGRWNKRKNPHQELSKFGVKLIFYQKTLSFYWDVCYNNIKILRLQRLAFSMPERIKKRRLKGKRGVFPLPACQRRIPALVLEGVRGFERQ